IWIFKAYDSILLEMRNLSHNDEGWYLCVILVKCNCTISVTANARAYLEVTDAIIP
ncbi:hypothetical protein U1Q18_051386, partial [Sarracenia purpurea var. burkii]